MLESKRSGPQGWAPRANEVRLDGVARAPGGPRRPSPFAGDPFMVSSTLREQTARAVTARAQRLIALVCEGRISDAVQGFYAPDVELGRAALAPMFRLDAEAAMRWSRRDVDAQWRRFSVDGVGVNGDTSFIECDLEFVSAEGDRFRQQHVAVAQWRDGLIVRECLIPRFPGRASLGDPPR